MKRQQFHWSKLDNAAKIFPATSTKQDTKVFRFTCELTEMVQEEHLQKALEKTMELFPLYQCTLRRGLFWYFFEKSRASAKVQEEHLPPCTTLYHPDRHGLLFSVTYYRCRINLEVFHSLTDGAGALAFLRLLVFHYLEDVHPELSEARTEMKDDVALLERMSDGFAQYYTGKHKYDKKKVARAYHISGRRLPQHQMRIIEGTVKASQVLALAHKYHTTVSVFLCALLLMAIQSQMKEYDKQKPVNLSVPVNLRNYFPSGSARNFFSVILVEYRFQENTDLQTVIAAVKEGFAKELTVEKVEGHFNELCALEHNLLTRMIPLILKDISLKVAHWLSEQEVTAAFSNVGRVDMPKMLLPYIRQFGLFLSTKRMQVCLCSYEDLLTMTFSTPFVDTSVQRYFFRSLAEMGVDVEITSNEDMGGDVR